MLIFPIRKAQPAAAVPRGRIGYDISAERLLLHTIQPKEVLEALLSTGVHVPDNSLVDPFHEDAYDWMRRQMAARLTTQGGGAVWFLALVHPPGSCPGPMSWRKCQCPPIGSP